MFGLRVLQCRARDLFLTLQACSADFGTPFAGPKIRAAGLQCQKKAPGAALQAPKVENRLRHPDQRSSGEAYQSRPPNDTPKMHTQGPLIGVYARFVNRASGSSAERHGRNTAQCAVFRSGPPAEHCTVCSVPVGRAGPEHGTMCRVPVGGPGRNIVHCAVFRPGPPRGEPTLDPRIRALAHGPRAIVHGPWALPTTRAGSPRYASHAMLCYAMLCYPCYAMLPGAL